MAAVDLPLAVLSLAGNPSQMVAAPTIGWQEQTEQPGSVRVMANGRRRVVTRRGGGRTLSWTMRLLTPAQVETVKGWAGHVVLIRDSRGRKEYGVYFGVEVADLKSPKDQDVRFVLQSVTFSDYL